MSWIDQLDDAIEDGVAAEKEQSATALRLIMSKSADYRRVAARNPAIIGQLSEDDRRTLLETVRREAASAVETAPVTTAPAVAEPAQPAAPMAVQPQEPAIEMSPLLRQMSAGGKDSASIRAQLLALPLAEREAAKADPDVWGALAAIDKMAVMSSLANKVPGQGEQAPAVQAAAVPAAAAPAATTSQPQPVDGPNWFIGAGQRAALERNSGLARPVQHVQPPTQQQPVQAPQPVANGSEIAAGNEAKAEQGRGPEATAANFAKPEPKAELGPLVPPPAKMSFKTVASKEGWARARYWAMRQPIVFVMLVFFIVEMIYMSQYHRSVGNQMIWLSWFLQNPDQLLAALRETGAWAPRSF